MTRNTRPWAVFVILSLVLVACTAGSDESGGTSDDSANGGQALATPDLNSETLVVNVAMTDTGFEPSTIFLPAGQHVQLILRNRGEHEHHYRIAGLIPFDLGWFVDSEIDLEGLTDDELESLGITDEADTDHVMHHLGPTVVPTKGASWSGINSFMGT